MDKHIGDKSYMCGMASSLFVCVCVCQCTCMFVWVSFCVYVSVCIYVIVCVSVCVCRQEWTTWTSMGETLPMVNGPILTL